MFLVENAELCLFWVLHWKNQNNKRVYDIMKRNRQSNIELLRVIAMLMVTILHALGHGGVLEQYEFGTLGYILFWTIETLCYVAVNVFVLITGYFMVTSESKPSRLIKLYFQVEFYSVLCLLASKVIFRQPIGLKNILNTIFPITSGSYWFVSAYAILLVLVPFLNRFINSMSKQQHLLSIILLSILFCVIPTFMFWSRDILGNGYNFIWFIVLYTTAAYIRLYSNEITRKHESIKCALLYLILSGGGVYLSGI